MRHDPLWIVPLLALLFAPALAAAAEGDAFFEKKIRPVLAEHCYSCHSAKAKKLKGGLRVDGRAALLAGGDNGPALVPGNPGESRLVKAVGYVDVDLQMPPRGKLSDAAIADLTAWVKAGAPWPEEKGTAGPGYAFDLAKRKGEHWCWQPIRVPPIPAVTQSDWPRSDIDRFLLARLEEKGLRPAGDTERATLLRRLSFNLIGLPPTPAEVEAFVKDPRSDVVERVVDRLLASQHFGERWGRHWLDLVRYAETRGHEYDFPLPNAYQYRDYVIRALNADVPYDRFVTEHIAGDLVPQPRRDPRTGGNESILGTGFWCLGEQLHSPVDVCQDKADRYDNMVDVMSKAFLGLTVACARCHDHKFDAISTKDYYALASFLDSSSYRLAPFDKIEDHRLLAEEFEKLQHAQGPVVVKELIAALRPGVAGLADELLALRDASARAADPKRLAGWGEVRKVALLDAQHVLHPWFATDPMGRLAALAEKARKPEAPSTTGLIVSYREGKKDGWLADGFAFGTRPTLVGEWRIDAAGSLRLREVAAAEYNRAWDRLAVAPGTEGEPGAVGPARRPGAMLRTPSFHIDSGRVFVLASGAGQYYAAVEGHVMIAGPLHGSLVGGFKIGPSPRWIEINLGPYQGRLAHLEFSPAPGSDLAILEVRQGEPAPPPFEPALGQLWLDLQKESKDLDQLARAYGRRFEAALVSLERSGPLDATDARLFNWLVQHADLLDPQAPARIAKLSARLQAEQGLLVARLTPMHLAPALLDANPIDGHVYIRGNYKTPGEKAARRFLEALAGSDTIRAAHGSGRLELAGQMTDPAIDPLLPRVLVNRLWHHLFGRGIVASVDNFGVLGEAPSHPELLDYLADRFVREGWSVKKMIRALVLTRAYGMSSAPSAEAERLDPDNRLLHRANIRRLEGEAIRDAVLAVSGRLDNKMFGPPVPVHLTEFQDGRGRPGNGALDGNGRRSVYLSVRRNFLSPFLQAFDAPTPFSTVGRRSLSNVPAQALILLNDPFMHQQAGVWATRVRAEHAGADARVTAMYQEALCRPPTGAELSACLAYVEEQTRVESEPAAWAGLAHVMFNTKEFVFLP